MKRPAVFSLWLVASAACALQPVGPFPLSEIDPNFNFGSAYVQSGLTGAAFVTYAPGNRGAKAFDVSRIYPVVGTGPGVRLALAGEGSDFKGFSFPGEPQAFASIRAAGASQIGNAWTLGGNVTLPNGKFSTDLYAGYMPKSTTDAFAAGASLTLGDSSRSTELLDWYLWDLVLGDDDPTTEVLENLAYYLAWIGEETDTPTCYRPRVRVVSLRNDARQLTLRGEGSLLIPAEGVCGVRFGAVRADPFTFANRLVTAYRARENNVELIYLHRAKVVEPVSASASAVAGAPPEFAIDTSFGGDGEVVVRGATAGVPVRYFDHAVDTQGRVLVVYGIGRSDGSYVPALLRLAQDGTLDGTFPNSGVATIPTTGSSTNPRTVTVDINGNIQVSGETYTQSTVRPFVYFLVRTSAQGAPETYRPKLVEYAFPGNANSAFFKHTREPHGTLTAVGVSYGAYPDVSTMRPLVVRIVGSPAAVPAIEFFHAGFGHYVTVVNPVEIAKLDSGETAGWARTQKGVHVYPLGTPGTSSVDRFFSQGFAKSSHVFAANAAESASIKQNRDWLFEGSVFGAILPNGSGKCPGSLHAVTRIYNNGLTGAPNHQFADDPATVGRALARGGTREGFGSAGAVYCVE